MFNSGPYIASILDMHKKDGGTDDKSRSGSIFENIIEFDLVNIYDFLSIKHGASINITYEDDMFGLQHEHKRILWKRVPYTSLLNFCGEGCSGVTDNPVTEFVIEIHEPIPTIEFPEDSFNEDGVLRVRLELKYQDVAGTVWQKNPHAIFELKYAIPEKNAILLIEGDYYKEAHRKYLSKLCEHPACFCGLESSKVLLMNKMDLYRWVESCTSEKEM